MRLACAQLANEGGDVPGNIDRTADASDDPTLVTADIDPERVGAVHDEFPAWHDRRR